MVMDNKNPFFQEHNSHHFIAIFSVNCTDHKETKNAAAKKCQREREKKDFKGLVLPLITKAT
jgi:hypothetical protein